MAKQKLLLYEVLTTVKGLDAKNPAEYLYPGTTEKPVLIELEENAATRDVVSSGAIRVWPGPSVAPAAPLKTTDLKSLGKAEDALVALLARIEKSLADPDLQPEDKTAIEEDKAEVEADLAKVREALK